MTWKEIVWMYRWKIKCESFEDSFLWGNFRLFPLNLKQNVYKFHLTWYMSWNKLFKLLWLQTNCMWPCRLIFKAITTINAWWTVILNLFPGNIGQHSTGEWELVSPNHIFYPVFTVNTNLWDPSEMNEDAFTKTLSRLHTPPRMFQASQKNNCLSITESEVTSTKNITNFHLSICIYLSKCLCLSVMLSCVLL